MTTAKDRRFEVEDLPDPVRSLSSCAFAPAAKLLVIRDQKSTIHVWDVSTGRKCHTFAMKSGSILSMSLSPDGRSVAARTRTGNKESVQIWEVATGKATHTVASDQRYPREVLFAPDGKTLAVVGGQDIRFHDVANGRENGRLRGTPFSPKVAFTPDGRTLAIGEMLGGAIHLWDVRTGAMKPGSAGHVSPSRGIFSPDGGRVASFGSTENTIFLWNPITGEALAQIRKDRNVRGCLFSADGRALFSSTLSEILEYSDAATGKVLDTLKLEDPARPDTRQWARNMRLSDDGKTLVVFSDYYSLKGSQLRGEDQLITGWDATTRKLLFRRRSASGRFRPRRLARREVASPVTG